MRLSTGLWVTHDVYEATRFPIFATDEPGFPIASIGGTIFLTWYKEKLFGVSARHILGRPMFEPNTLIAHERNREPRGEKLEVLGASTLGTPSVETDQGADDALDLVIWEFASKRHKQVQAYHWDVETICEATHKSVLLVVGYLIDKSEITPLDAITSRADAQVCKFAFRHLRTRGDDQSSMRAIADFSKTEAKQFGNFRGLSGAPVFDTEKDRICGMVLRGGIDQSTGIAQIYFMSALYIDRCLASVYRNDPKIDLAIQVF
jgi:hypothetical protein